jgi:hypothetical protein
MTRRAPKKSAGFSWGRFPMGEGLVCYRLFRRDHSGSLHMLAVDFRPGMPRVAVARQLRAARRALRDQVDTIDLRAMGVAA